MAKIEDEKVGKIEGEIIEVGSRNAEVGKKEQRTDI